MALRCLLFTADEAAAAPIREVLASLRVEGKHCSAAVDAIERVANQNFQIVIIDWDAQPEAGLLLEAARERKAGERPLTLAMVSNDASVPQALQAGANSILRKPILINQAKDTLTTARDLLRAKQESAAAQSAAPAAAPVTLPANLQAGAEKTLRAGEFLQSTGPAPGAQFITESDLPQTAGQELAEPVDALAELEPMAAAVVPAEPKEEQVTSAPAEPDEPRGLQWYLNKRASKLPPVPGKVPAPPPPVAPPAPERIELLGYDQAVPYQPSPGSTPSASSSGSGSEGWKDVEPVPSMEVQSIPPEGHEHPTESFSDTPSREESGEARPRFRLGKRAIAAAVALAACGVAAAPQAPWHGRVRTLWGRGQQSLHAWLNPQVVTPTQAPVSHEDFARAGDEYKLPVAENIPDATTDPSQIRVTPVVDPTAKKTDAAANADAGAAPADATGNAGDAAQSSGIQVQENPAAVPGRSAAVGSGGASAPAASVPAAAATQPHSDAAASVAPQFKPQPGSPQVRVVASSGRPAASLSTSNPPIPSSLTSQMASMTPAAGGDKPPEAAMQAIEPVNVPESAERGLLTDQPAIAYPASAKGQEGTVVLLVLIGRDGTVQDAKFFQGSLAFARAAIDGVKQWKFKPYVMNGRPVSVTTQLSMTFKPGP